MTPLERAESLMAAWRNQTMWSEEMVTTMMRAIEAAELEAERRGELKGIEEEREACAKIADDLARRTREEWEENPLLSLRGTENCEAIRDAIRARSSN